MSPLPETVASTEGVLALLAPDVLAGAAAEAFERQAERMLAAAGVHLAPARVRAVVIDFTELRGYDGAGLRAIRAVADQCRRAGVALLQVGLPHTIADALKLQALEHTLARIAPETTR